MYRKDQEGIQSSLTYLPPKVAITVLRFPPRISLISVRGYAQKCLRTHRWPLGLVFLQAIRVLQAMLDIVSDEGWLSPAVRIILLLQMIVQARWINENSLLTLPGNTSIYDDDDDDNKNDNHSNGHSDKKKQQ